MERSTAKKLAQELLDSEFNEVNNNPIDYMKSMGWEVDQARVKRARVAQELLNFKKQDVEDLAEIILNLPSSDVLSIAESNKVNDFLANTVARALNELNV